MSQFSQKPSYSHLLGEERPILGISIYISLKKKTDFCVVRRNAISRRARTQQVFHKNELCYLKGFHTYCILKMDGWTDGCMNRCIGDMDG